MALTACPSCSVYVRREERGCPHCGAELANTTPIARTAAAVLMGLTLAGCPANDEPGDSMASSAAYGVPTTDTASTSGDGSSTTSGGEGSTSTGAAESTGTSDSTGGGADTEGSTGTGGTTGTAGSTGISPDYGVPTTG